MPPALSRGAKQRIFEAADTSPRIQRMLALLLDEPLLIELASIAGDPASGASSVAIRPILTFLANKRASASQGLCDALDARKKRQLRIQNVHHDVVRELGLDWSAAKVAAWNESLPQASYRKLKSPYPEPGKFVCEDEEIMDLWSHQITEAKQADKRLKRCELAVLDPSKLVRTVEPTQDLVVRDEESGEIVLMVVRHFLRNIDTIDWMENIVAEAAEISRSIRKEDPGHLSLAGFSAGSRKKPQFHWARNIIRKLPSQDVLNFHQRQSCAFGLFWNMLLKRLPAEILDEWERWMAKEMLPGMNPLWSGEARGDPAGACSFPVYNETVRLNRAQYAPPAGVMAQNYSRAIHYEKQPHRWAASHTLSRDGFQDSDGGHFYVAAYGIRVMSAPDTLVVWQPRQYHGTSLQRISPRSTDPHMVQRGMAFVTSSRLPSVWQAYVKKLEKIENEQIDEAKKTAEAERVAELLELEVESGGNHSGDIYFDDEVDI